MGSPEVQNEAMAALEEQFGRDSLAVMEGDVDGVVSFSVDSPDLGRVRYVYDSRTGEGRVTRGD
jgi:RecB family exonuclease